jgi:hypothetical protein
MTTYRYAVTIHDGGNITDDPDNVRTILTSTDNIQPRDRVEVVALAPDPETTTDQLADVLARLADIEPDEPAPIRAALADRMRGRTFTAPRGAVLTTPAEGEGSPLYVENKHGRIWTEETNTSREGLQQQNLTIYGSLTRGGKTTRGSVDIWHRVNGDPEHATRAYWHTLTGAAVPDGAREHIAALVLADLGAIDWPALAVETERVARAAGIRRHIEEARRRIEDARRALAVEVTR